MLIRAADRPAPAAGTPFREVRLTPKTLGFLQAQFRLDPAWVKLATKADLSVVYQGGQVAAYKVKVPGPEGSSLNVYDVRNPAYRPPEELVAELSPGRLAGVPLRGRDVVALPSGVSVERYEFKSSGRLECDPEVRAMLGLPEEVDLHQPKGESFGDRFRLFSSLLAEDPEYRMLKLSDTLEDLGAGLLLGVMTARLWEQGAAYGIASTVSSLRSIGSPVVGILGESALGGLVDRAVNSEDPLESLKKVNLVTAGLAAASAGCHLALHPSVITAIASEPALPFVGLYAAATAATAVSEVVRKKAEFALHDQIINKGPHSRPEYRENFFQILGVESSLGRAVYLGSYLLGVAGAAAFPGATLAMAGVGAAVWGVSNFLFPLSRVKPDMKVTLEGSAVIQDGGRYIFDSGWEATFEGEGVRLRREDTEHYSLSFDRGRLRLESDRAAGAHRTRGLFKRGWELDDGEQTVTIAPRKRNSFELQAVSDTEFLLASE